jgi:predicted nucleic acid-binding Zn finger protein
MDAVSSPNCWSCSNIANFAVTLSNSNSSPSQVVIIFGKNGRYLLQQFSVSCCHLSQVDKKQTPRAHICAQLSAMHPSVEEEVEGYENNFVSIS